MPKNKIGVIEKIGVDADGLEIFRVRVEAGTRKKRATKRVTIHGTMRDAQAAASMLYVELNSSLSERDIPEITLNQYFYGRFIPALEKEGKTNSTINGYVKNYRKWISPNHGERVLLNLDETNVRNLIEQSGTPRNTLRTYRAILNRAKSDGFMRHKMDLTGLDARAKKQKRPVPWSPLELKYAADALVDDEMAYLTLLVGSAGLRKEENLAITPADVQILKMPTSQGVKKYVLLNVHAAYTDEDGLKVTKTEESNRHALVLPEFTERFLSALEATKPSIEQVEGCWLIRHKTSWHKSRKAKYRIETVMGNRKDAQAVASRLAAETAAKYKLGSNPKLKEVADGIWTVTVFNGYVDTMERTIAPEAFIGTEQDATRHALEQWSNRRILPCAGETLRGHWETALRKHGLRFIPVNNLRHTSETLMAASGVSTPTISSMHGHTQFKTDFQHYIDLNVEAILDAADKVDTFMASDMASGGFTLEPLIEKKDF